ncbi:MAG: glycoside hydrolase family 65 protein [Thermoleophilia bacterium]|nr:glycoside hydrolase family 65 protein [Thermoleophilia bacterium]MDH5332455.1 glycoside hydrolase family 65 protein [Thermoleophilia bacterium]
MRHRRRIDRPERIYPIDDWAIVEREFRPESLGLTEALFAVSNGYIGLRACPEEGRPTVENATFVNGLYETWQIIHGETAYGFAKTGQTIVNATDSKIVKLFVDDEFFNLQRAELLSFERKLNMRAGTLDRVAVWETPGGKHVRIASRRLVSFEQRHLCAISYEVTLLNGAAPVVISSELLAPGETATQDVEVEDPRRGTVLPGRVLEPTLHGAAGLQAVLCHRTRRSDIRLSCGIDHLVETDCAYEAQAKSSENFGQVVVQVDAEAGKPIRLTKFMAYHHSFSASPEQLASRATWTLDRAKLHGFAALLASQERFVADFWHRSDIEVQVSPERRSDQGWIQQAIRFNLFHLLQASARTDGAGIPAKGLTGSAYEGHYFWDTEVYVLPFLTYTSPDWARNLLLHRHSQLGPARERARLLNQRGAKYPWRSINGEEASAYYAAGTAQYHINADIAYALRRYVVMTGDSEFLYDKGVEILVETARLWADLGYHSDRLDGRFVIHGVTGPDEYTTVVNNNTFTNLMARENLRYAADAVEQLQREDPDRFTALVDRTGLDPTELDEWRSAAERMFVAFDERTGIHPQDDDFLDKEIWDVEGTPADLYPLLLHFHPLVIYRHQVVKQADVVLAMLLLPDDFTRKQRRHNFDYYDPLTTGDSSLSASVQAIMALDVGRYELAREYAQAAVVMDLGDVQGNARDGCHIAAMGGAWMVAVYGIAGFRDQDGRLRFKPICPDGWQRVSFRLRVRDTVLRVEIEPDSARYTLEQGEELTLWHRVEEIRLTRHEAVAERGPFARPARKATGA